MSGKKIDIHHYKDIFNRPGQDFLVQKHSQKLILARRHDNFLYKGAAMYERYGHSKFYYATMMMNCIYNCAYCYLQGLYPSANIVAFVNPEDYFPAVKEALPAYLSISYEADILALEDLFGYVKIWIEFARKHTDLTLEIRSKSANFAAIADIHPLDNVILAWTVSPQSVIDDFEAGTPSLLSRLSSIKAAIENGWPVRLCIDPVLPISGWEKIYDEMIEQIEAVISLKDISIGGFRMPEAQYKKLRKIRPGFPILTNDTSEEVFNWKSKISKLYKS